MKKIFLTLTALIVACITLLSGCSCVPAVPLTFNQNFAGGDGAPTNFNTKYKEVLTYDVNYVSEYNSSLKINENLDKELLPTYSNGKYVSTFYGDVGSLPIGVQTDINYTDSDIHHIKTEFSIDTKINGTTYKEQIISEAYFYSANYSFAPIYSRTILKNAFVYIDVETDTIAERLQIFEYVTKYNQSSYVQTKKYYQSDKKTPEEINAEIKDIDITSPELVSKLVDYEAEKTHGYSIKQAIDNVQLLFAIRNLDVAVEKSVSVPTISPTYGTPKNLAIKNQSESTKDVTISFNGATSEVEKMSVKNMSFVIGGTDNAGSAQYVVIQKSKTDKIPFRALPVEYAETLVEYNTFAQMGALKYTLTSVTVTE